VAAGTTPAIAGHEVSSELMRLQLADLGVIPGGYNLRALRSSFGTERISINARAIPIAPAQPYELVGALVGRPDLVLVILYGGTTPLPHCMRFYAGVNGQ